MIPVSLRLRGAIGLRDGLGLEEVEIDFTRFSPGLICLVGANGSGKSTILENMHPYPCLASRSGALTDHFYLNDSYRDFSFEIGRMRYRAFILIDPRRKSCEAYLYLDGRALNDGKISTYRLAVEGLLGSETLFFKSIFAAQGALGITHLAPAKRKEIFFELLGLDRYERYLKYVGKQSDVLKLEFAARKALLEQARRELEHRGEYHERFQSAGARLLEIQNDLRLKQKELSQAEVALEEMRRLSEVARLKQKEAKELSADIERLERLLRSEQARSNTEEKKLEREHSAVCQALQRVLQVSARGEEIQSKISTLGGLREEAKVLEQSEKDLLGLEHEEAQARLAHQRVIEDFNREEARLIRKRDHLAAEEKLLRQDAAAELKNCQEQLKRARNEASLIERVPCRTAAGLPEQCLLLSKAISARDQINELQDRASLLQSEEYLEEKGLQRIREHILISEVTLDGIAADRPVFDEEPFEQRKRDLAYDRARHQAVKALILKLEDEHWEERHEELKLAGSVEGEKRSSLESINRRIADHAARLAEATHGIQSQIDEKLERRKSLRLEEEIPDDRKAIKRREKLQDELARLRASELDSASERAAAEASIKRLDDVERNSRLAQEEASRLARTLEHWKLLQQACSKDGIPALELDAAGPAVSRIANELLAASFGARFQIRFETTRASRDGKKLLETFDVQVFGDQGEKSIDDLSGGERVWIERSISEAIAIHLSETSGREYLTSFQDESDGALDPDNRQNFLVMLQKSFKLGRRSFTFLITQSPETWQQVEQRICLEPATSSIRLVS